jgi:hypothetical protein
MGATATRHEERQMNKTTFAIKSGELYFNGFNCHGTAVYGSEIMEAKHYDEKLSAVKDKDETVGGEVILVAPCWC